MTEHCESGGRNAVRRRNGAHLNFPFSGGACRVTLNTSVLVPKIFVLSSLSLSFSASLPLFTCPYFNHISSCRSAVPWWKAGKLQIVMLIISRLPITFAFPFLRFGVKLGL